MYLCLHVHAYVRAYACARTYADIFRAYFCWDGVMVRLFGFELSNTATEHVYVHRALSVVVCTAVIFENGLK